MKPALLQLQVPERIERFRRVLVYGEPADAILLLTQALPLIGRGADVQVASTGVGRDGAERSLQALLDGLARSGLDVNREPTPHLDAAFLGRHAARRHDLVLKAIAAGPAGTVALDALDLALLSAWECVAWFGRGGPMIPRRIAAACDPPDERSLPLARRVLMLADTMAAATGAELYVTHAWRAFRAELLADRVDLAIVGERGRDAGVAAPPPRARQAIRDAHGSVVVVKPSSQDERSAD